MMDTRKLVVRCENGHIFRPGIGDVQQGHWCGICAYGRSEIIYENIGQCTEALGRLGIRTMQEYGERYREDPRLPSSPQTTYRNEWRGTRHFLGKQDYYPTLQAAMRAAEALGINSPKMYAVRRKEDAKLPSSPRTFYDGWRGWPHFFGRRRQDYYPTLQAAMRATKLLGINCQRDYAEMRCNDSRLPSTPSRHYKGWRGWAHFCYRKTNSKYDTIEECMTAVAKLGIKTVTEYRRHLKSAGNNSRLPTHPPRKYEAKWQSWPHFFGRTPNKPYPTIIESRAAVEKLGIRSCTEYRQRHKEDRKLPSNPWTFYQGWRGWPNFFGRKKRLTRWSNA